MGAEIRLGPFLCMNEADVNSEAESFTLMPVSHYEEDLLVLEQGNPQGILRESSGDPHSVTQALFARGPSVF